MSFSPKSEPAPRRKENSQRRLSPFYFLPIADWSTWNCCTSNPSAWLVMTDTNDVPSVRQIACHSCAATYRRFVPAGYILSI